MFAEDMSLVVLCQQCDDAACVHSCPTDALSLNESTGVVDVDMEKCINCRMCSIACPFGNITIEPETMNVIKCDLCGGDPVCAKFCPTKALEFAVKPSPDPPPGTKTRAVPPLPWEIQQKIEQK